MAFDRAPLSASEHRLALLDKSRHSLEMILGRGGRCQALGFTVRLFIPRIVERGADQALDQTESERRPVRQSTGDRCRLFLQGCGCRDPIDDPEMFCGLGRKAFAEQGQFERPSLAHESGEEISGAPVGRKSDMPVSECEHRVIAGDGEIGGEHQAQTKAGCRTFDRGQHRFGHAA